MTMKSKTRMITAIMIGAMFFLAGCGTFTTKPPQAGAKRQMENLGRGVVAINQGDGNVFVSWRMLGAEPDAIAFNLYRSTGGGVPVKLNKEPITKSTSYQDTGVDLTRDNAYFVRPVLNGREQAASKPFLNTIAANAPVRPYFSIPLKTPQGYSPNDASVGDLDGDGEYEIVVHMTGVGRDNARAGMTDEPILQAYKLDGTFMWSINLGKNIREGAHYTQFMVYDLDGDGKAEIVCKTADGTVDGKGKVIGDPNASYVNPEGTIITALNRQGVEVQQNVSGFILKGPEYLTVFDGQTGAALATTDYIPSRGGDGSAWGDPRGNRVDRFLACVAYLDGVRPSVVMCRGYYTRAVLVAWDWRRSKLAKRWVFDSDDGTPGNEKYRGQGDHQLSVGDVDGDGKDEIVYGACVIDHDGKGLYSTGRGHGDAMHLSDLDPDRPGLEVFMVHERPSAYSGADFRDARTGELIWGLPSVRDAGRGMAANLDPRYKGYQCWSNPSDGLYTCKGVKISDKKPRSCNFAVWWDGDLLRELLDRNYIAKWNWWDGTETNLVTAVDCTSNNGTKATPALSGDLFGDWREEVIWRTTDNKELRIYTTTIPTEYRFCTLMHDPQYRLAIAWQNVAYNQPPHPGFYLGEGMAPPPRPNITLVRPKSGQ
jgi:rhamnogalacturonan endolyase